MIFPVYFAEVNIASEKPREFLAAGIKNFLVPRQTNLEGIRETLRARIILLIRLRMGYVIMFDVIIFIFSLYHICMRNFGGKENEEKVREMLSFGNVYIKYFILSLNFLS